MTLYVDSSAFLKRYVDEPESDACEALLLADPSWVTGRLTLVEVRRNLARLLPAKGLAMAQAAPVGRSICARGSGTGRPANRSANQSALVWSTSVIAPPRTWPSPS